MEQVSERSTYSRPRVYEILGAARRVLGLSESLGRPYNLDLLVRELTVALGQVSVVEHPAQLSRPSSRMMPIAASKQRMNEVRL
jgi:uncharacterized membrane protein